MIERSVRAQIAKSPTHSIAGYRIGSGTENGSGLIDGLLMLIAAVAQQAIDEKCECEGCARWIQISMDWGMADMTTWKSGVRHRVSQNQYWYEDYNE